MAKDDEKAALWESLIAFNRACQTAAETGQGIPSGMSLRDWFAGQALPSVIATFHPREREPGESIEHLLVRRAYAVADAMLEARKC